VARAAALLAALLIACASPPPLPSVPAWDAPGGAGAVADDERALWTEAKEGVEKLEPEDFVEDEALLRYLDSVLAALLPPGVSPEMPPSRVRVLRTAELNAGALPDGTVLLSTSFLAAIADEAQLAALLGHELAHLLRRHSLVEHRYERLSGSTVRRMEVSRQLEDEADALGLALLERAGYEPRAVLEMLALIADDDAERSLYPQFESHPFVTERMRALRGKIPRSAPEHGRRDAARYEAAVLGVLLVAAEEELEEGELERAEAAIERHLRLRPDSGRAWYLEAERQRRIERDGRRAPAARRAYERAVELAPDDPDALRALGFLCRETGETERARTLLGDYLRVAPDAPDRKLIERYLDESRPGGP
jgi:predicted Zn-dependent protease